MPGRDSSPAQHCPLLSQADTGLGIKKARKMFLKTVTLIFKKVTWSHINNKIVFFCIEVDSDLRLDVL